MNCLSSMQTGVFSVKFHVIDTLQIISSLTAQNDNAAFLCSFCHTLLLLWGNNKYMPYSEYIDSPISAFRFQIQCYSSGSF